MKKEKYIDLDGQELTKTTLATGDVRYTNKLGQIHRLDGPAVIWSNGTKVWFKNGRYHREDGPAVVYPDGEENYYLEGEGVSRKDIDLYWLKKQVCK